MEEINWGIIKQLDYLYQGNLERQLKDLKVSFVSKKLIEPSIFYTKNSLEGNLGFQTISLNGFLFGDLWREASYLYFQMLTGIGAKM